MLTEMMVEAAMLEIKENIERLCQEPAEAALSPDSAEEVGRGIHQALAAAGKAAFRTFLEAKEEPCDILVSEGETFRFKALIPKSFWTIWGKMEVLRKVFQNAPDTKTHVPLDSNWGMAGEIATREVREATAFACAHVTPKEAAALFEKTAMFHPHPTVIKEALKRVEARVEPCREELDRHPRLGHLRQIQSMGRVLGTVQETRKRSLSGIMRAAPFNNELLLISP